MSQDQLAKSHFGGDKSVAERQWINKTAAGYSGSGPRLEIRIAQPTGRQQSSHEGAMITVESSYLGELLDEPISQKNPDNTLRLLARAIAVLQDLTEILLPSDALCMCCIRQPVPQQQRSEASLTRWPQSLAARRRTKIDPRSNDRGVLAYFGKDASHQYLHDGYVISCDNASSQKSTTRHRNVRFHNWRHKCCQSASHPVTDVCNKLSRMAAFGTP